MEKKILYAITTEDVTTVLGADKVFSGQELDLIADKIGDFLGDRWHSAIEYALEELKRSNHYGVNRGT